MKHLVSLMTALCLGSGGCSYAFVRPPRAANPVTRTPAAANGCTSNYVAPVLDGIFAGYQTVRTFAAIKASDSVYVKSPISREADIGIGVGLAVLGLASSIYGQRHVGECRKLVDQEQVRLAAEQSRRRAETDAAVKEMMRKMREEQAAKAAAPASEGEVSAP